MLWLILAPFVFAAPLEDKTYLVGSFDRLRVDGPFTVEILPGTPQVSAPGDGKAIAGISVRQEGSTLIVSTGTIGWEKRTTEAPGAVTVTIHVPALRMITANGGAMIRVAALRGPRIDLGLGGPGAIHVATVQADDLNVTLTGGGTVTLAGTAVRTRMRSWGTGSIAAEGLNVGDAVLLAESSGDLRIAVRNAAQISARGTGNVIVSGGAKCRVTGNGPVDCPNR